MTRSLVRCGKCGAEMVSQYEDGKRKLRANIVVWSGQGCTGKCRRCGNDVPLDLELSTPPPKRKKIVHFVIKH